MPKSRHMLQMKKINQASEREAGKKRGRMVYLNAYAMQLAK